jgi:PAS domain S-box-containing protein
MVKESSPDKGKGISSTGSPESNSELQEKYRLLFEFAVDPIFHGDESGKILTVNVKASELTGYSRDELLKMNFSELFPGKELEVKPLRYDLLKSNGFFSTHREIICKSGHRITIGMHSGKLPDGSFLCIARDITDRLKAEEDLRQSEERYRKLVESSPVGIAVYQDAKFVYINPAGLLIMGCKSQEELLGKNVLSIVHPESREIVVSRMTLVAGGQQVPAMEERLIKSDGTAFYAEVTALLTTYNGKPAGQVIVRDISERKKAEEDLLTINRQLKELNATKDKLFSIIAHDLKSPFTGILGLSEILAGNIRELDLETSEIYAAQINMSAKHTLVLLENLLAWAKTQTGQMDYKPVKLNLKTIFFENSLVFVPLAETKNIDLVFDKIGDMFVFADENMLDTILRNLISNAIKFTHKEGQVKVGASYSGNQVEISVTDTGTGIDNEILEKIFRKDFHTSNPGTEGEKGTGLGLILCREFTIKNGGRIWAESTLGKGSKFHFTLPAVLY